jgi:hypothetical protein
MIALEPSRTILDRFVLELDAQAPTRRPALAPDLSLGTAEDRDAAQMAWAGRVVDEHRSVIVFSELLTRLARAEAPFDALCAVQRLIGDELRHVRLCAQMSAGFASLGALAIDLEDLGLPPTDAPDAVRALEIVARELVVAEAESVRVLRAYRDAATDPACHAALELLLLDEARHAAAGRALFDRLVAAFDPALLAPLLAELPATLEADRLHIATLHAASATGGPGRCYGASIRPGEAPPIPHDGAERGAVRR